MLIRVILLFSLLSPFYLSGCSSDSDDSGSSTASTLSFSVIGPGSVISSDGSLDCYSTCATTYSVASTVHLTAVPTTGARFLGWSWSGCQPMDGPDCDVPVGPGKNNLQLIAEFESLAMKVYDITFEEPAHTISMSPSFGTTPEYVSEYFSDSGSSGLFAPKIADGHGTLTSQVLLFQPRNIVGGTSIIPDGLTLALNHGADSYKIEFDLVVTEVASFSPFRVLFDWPSSNDLEFNLSGEILFGGTLIGSFVAGEKLHVVTEISIVNRQAVININGTSSGALALDVLTTDINNIRMHLGGELTSRAAIDNIHITALLSEQLPNPEPDSAGKYVIDFELPIITSTNGQDSYGPRPYGEDGFNITYPLRFDPAIVGFNVPTNGSIHAGYTINSVPIIYHQYGYPFQLLSMDVAQYSIFLERTSDLVITGITKTGLVKTKAISNTMFSMFFNTITFDPSWSDLFYVIINDDGFAMDNIVVKINEEKIGFPAP